MPTGRKAKSHRERLSERDAFSVCDSPINPTKGVEEGRNDLLTLLWSNKLQVMFINQDPVNVLGGSKTEGNYLEHLKAA